MPDEAFDQAVARACHDMRQPLQTLSILIDILRRRINDSETLRLLERQETAIRQIIVHLDEIDKALPKR